MPAPDPDFQRYLATGGEAAFRAMVAEHLGMVLATVARKLGPHAHLAQDVAQAVFTRLARVAQGLPRDLILAPWLHRQAVRLAIDVVRKEERRLRRETSAAMLHAPDSAPGPSNADAALLLDEALDQLPAADRTVLVLRYLEDRDFVSVAQSLGSTPEAARKRIARSLEKLRALLTRRGVVLTTGALTGFLTAQSSQAAPAALAVRMSASALKSAASSGNTAAILTTALMSHAAAVTTGALAALLACGLFYQQREKEIARISARPVVVVPVAAVDRSARMDDPVEPSMPVPGTLQEIIAALEEITNGPYTLRARERSEELLRHVRPEQYLEFYLSAEPRIHPTRWLAVVQDSVSAWRSVDPAGLTRALFESDARKTGQIREASVSGTCNFNSFGSEKYSISVERADCFKDWLGADVDAAGAWLLRQRQSAMLSEAPGHRLFEYLALMYASVGGSGLVQQIAAGMSEPERRALFDTWSRVKQKRAGGLAEAVGLAENRQEREALILGNIEALGSLEKSWEALELAPPGERFDLAAQLLSAGLFLRPTGIPEPSADEQFRQMDAVMNRAFNIPEADALERLVTARLDSENRPGTGELLQWVKGKPADSASRALSTGACTLAAQRFGQTAAIEWAAAIPDAGQRGPLLRGIFLRWQDAEPDAARRFLTSAPPEIADELQPLAALTP